MKKGLLIALAACALALCLGLAGCGGEDPREEFIGTWELESCSGDDMQLSSEDLSMLKDVDMLCMLTLGEDGTALLNMFGQALEGEWKDKGEREGVVTFDGDKADMTIDDAGKMTVEQSGVSLIFVPQQNNATE